MAKAKNLWGGSKTVTATRKTRPNGSWSDFAHPVTCRPGEFAVTITRRQGMRYLPQMLLVSGVLGSTVVVGCNETTRNDVTAARNRVDKEEKRLQEMKRNEGRAINEEKREADQART